MVDEFLPVITAINLIWLAGFYVWTRSVFRDYAAWSTSVTKNALRLNGDINDLESRVTAMERSRTQTNPSNTPNMKTFTDLAKQAHEETEHDHDE